MRKQWCARALLVVVLLRGLPVLAQEQPPALPATVTLEEVLRLLAERSPRTAADRASVAVTAADRVTAETLPNPTLSYGGVHLVSGLSTGATTQHQLIVEQPLLLFHQRQARLDAANANVKAEEAHVAESLADRRLEVRRAFASLLSKQAQLTIVQESLTDLERVAQLVRGRAAAGDRSQYDVLRIDTLKPDRCGRGGHERRHRRSRKRPDNWRRCSALPGWSPRAVGHARRRRRVDRRRDALADVAQQRRPALVALRQQQAAARVAACFSRVGSGCRCRRASGMARSSRTT